jgi:hypothetical protein
VPEPVLLIAGSYSVARPEVTGRRIGVSKKVAEAEAEAKAVEALAAALAAEVKAKAKTSPTATDSTDADKPARPKSDRNPKVGKSRPTPPPLEKAHHIDRRAGRLIEPGDDDELLTTVRVADWLGTSCQWLELGRSTNYGPKFKRISERIIRYRRGDVNVWLKSRTRSCVAEYANG